MFCISDHLPAKQQITFVTQAKYYKKVTELPN